MNLFKNKTVSSYIGLFLAVLAIALSVFGGTTLGLVGDTFPSLIIVFLILGAALGVLGFLFDQIELFSMLAPIFYGLALGFVFLNGIEVLVYAGIGIDNNVGGQSALTLAYLIIGGILLIGSIVNAFFSPKKAA